MWQNIESIRMGNTVNKLCKQIEDLENDNRYLQIKNEELSDPKRIIKIAKERLKMQRTTSGSVIILSEN